MAMSGCHVLQIIKSSGDAFKGATGG